MQALALTAVFGGAGLSAYGTLQEGKQAAEYGKIQQQQLNAEAKANIQAGNVESREKRKEGARAQAARIAQIGAQGGVLTGTSLTAMADEAFEYEADARMISYNYGLRATQLQNAGKLARYEGQVARRASRIRAFSNAMQTAGMMYLMGGVSSKGGGIPKGTIQGVRPLTRQAGATIAKY